MKTIKKIFLLLIGAGVLALGVVAFRSSSDRAISTAPSKTDQRILRAMQVVEKMPNRSEGYNQLASAYMQKARETADFDLNANADEAITRSLTVEPDNYDALKLRAKLQLTYHRFTDALETARRAQSVRTDDHDVWGQITDTLVELGDYEGAVRAAKKMVELRPDTSSYSRVSYLRSLHGDTEGAIQAMVAAVKAANPNDPEGAAWCRVQLGNELMSAGKLDTAERAFDEALRIFPDHPLALRGKAEARKAAGDIQGAIQICEQEQANGDSADAAQMLGELYTLLDRKDAALKAYEKFETLERENAVREKSWRHMIDYWLDHDRNLAEALALATREYEARKDIFTCDSLAWALFKNGRTAEAKKLIAEALRTGSKDARINQHASIILKKPLTIQGSSASLCPRLSRGASHLAKERTDLMQGTLELLILNTLARESMHGYGVVQRIQEAAEDLLKVEDGSLYPALYRMEERGWIKSEWGISENNRRAKFYKLTRAGQKQLEAERANWNRISKAVTKILQAT